MNITDGKSILRIAFLLLVAAALLLTSEILKAGFFHTATHEIGFAVLVAAVIWLMFESQLRQEAEAIWDKRIENATRNVFQAVLRKDLPKGLLDEANNLVLNSSLVRSDFSVTYTLKDATFPSDGLATDCVLVDAIMEFTMRNVSTDEVQWGACLRLPNPIHPGMKEIVKVHSLSVRKGADLVPLDLIGAEADFRQSILDDDQTAIAFNAGRVALQPGESCTCSTNYTMAKEVEDSELLQTLHPSDGCRITVFDQSADGRRVIFARSVHRQDLQVERPITSGQSTQIFRIPGYLLPHQGILIWWKRKPKLGRLMEVPLPRGVENVIPRQIEEIDHGS